MQALNIADQLGDVMRSIRSLVVLGALVSGAASAAPCAGFVDVDDSNATYCSAVTYVKTTGITLGCDATHYCPADPTTRLQMALFLQRMGGITFQQGANSFGAAATLGTNDDYAVNIVAGGVRVASYQPTGGSPNVVGGSFTNSSLVSAEGQTIAGGGSSATGCYDPLLQAYTRACQNYTKGAFATIAGGEANLAYADSTTVGGGTSNTAGDVGATVGGGIDNVANAYEAYVGGGASNSATGPGSTIPGGLSNVANGDYSFAAGHAAKAMGAGCFVWSDTSDTDFECNTVNAFMARASGGFSLRSNAAGTVGVDLPAGSGSWATASDRALKENIVAVEPRSVLERVVGMPIATWNYRAQGNAVRHMGPMAQDFYASFGLGDSDKTISVVDAEGIALAAIQALNAKLGEKQAHIEALEHRIEKLEAALSH